MRLVFNCPHCRKEYEVDQKLAGRKSRCGKCAQTFRIPTPTPDDPAPKAKASSASWDEPLPYFEVVEDQPVRSFKTAPAEPVYFEEDLPPPPRVAPIDHAKKKPSRKRYESDSEAWDPFLKAYLGFSFVSMAIILLMAWAGLLRMPGVGMIGIGLAGLVAVVSVVALLAGGFGLLIAVARESVYCLLMFLFVPFYGLFYLITRWQQVRGPWALSFSAYLVIIAMSFVMTFARAISGPAPGAPPPAPPVATRLVPGAPAPGPTITPNLGRLSSAPAATLRYVTLILHGLPPNPSQGLGPSETDVLQAIKAKLKHLVPNCGAISMNSADGVVRVRVLGATTADSLASVIDFGRARVSGEEIDVQVSEEFIASTPTPGAELQASRRGRQADRFPSQPPPPQSVNSGPGQLAGDAAFPGDDPVAKSLSEITAGDPHHRKQAVERLARIAPNQHLPEVVQALIPLLVDDDGFLASEAVKALAIWKSPDSVNALIQCMNDTRFFVRKEAIKALGKIGDPRAVEPMMTHWEEDGHEVEQALKAMGPPAEKGVLTRLAVGDPQMRRRICDILAVIGGQDTLHAMQRMRADPDMGVQMASKNAWRAIVARVGPPTPVKKK